MLLRTFLFVCLGILSVIMVGSVSQAHDMWLEESDNGYIVALGHKGEIDPYEPERVRQVVAYTMHGWAEEMRVDCREDQCSIFADEPFCAFTAVLDNKYWYETTDGWKNQRDNAGLEIIEEGRSYKYTKHIARWCDFLAKPLGQRIEIVPLKDPSSMKQGDRLPVKLFFEGKPLTNARLSGSSNMKSTHSLKEISGEGPFLVEVGPPGAQLINAKYRMPVEGKQVVWFAVSMTFKTKK